MVRLKSAIWVAAYLRRLAGQGINGYVLAHGAEEAGAIFVKVNRLDGRADLYGPAPQSAFEDDRPGPDRLFERLAEAVPEAEVDQRLKREAGFDPDLWAVEVEDRAGRHGLDLVRPPPPDLF